MIRLSLFELCGKGYVRGWWKNFKGRYRVYKGARNTKKSYVMIGLEIIDKILTDERRNVLVLRNTLKANKKSVFISIRKKINALGLSSYFDINKSELTITYIPTGQVIMFMGFDDPQKIQSIEVLVGYLTDVYVEEAYEIESFEEWDVVDGSIRGALPDGLFHQITFCLNGWNKNHWIYEKFFKGRLEDDKAYLMTHKFMDYKNEDEIIGWGRGIYLHISTYKINEFRDKKIYDAAMEKLRVTAPQLYEVVALGMWGCTSETVYPEFSDKLILPRAEINKMRYSCYAIGLDTGLSDGEGHINKEGRIGSATTMQMVGLTDDYEKVCCIDEYFWTNQGKSETEQKTEPMLYEDIVNTLLMWKQRYIQNPTIMKGTILVYVDCADKGFRQGLELKAREKGLYNVRFEPSTKIKIQTRVDFIRLIMAYGEFLISEACANLTREIKNSVRGKDGRCREDIDDHAINANEYAWIPIINRLKAWKTFKEH